MKTDRPTSPKGQKNIQATTALLESAGALNAIKCFL